MGIVGEAVRERVVGEDLRGVDGVDFEGVEVVGGDWAGGGLDFSFSWAAFRADSFVR